MPWRRDLPPAAQLPTGLAGMVAHENRLLTEPSELVHALGVAMDDLLIQKEPGTVAYDTSGLVVAPSFSGTFSDAQTLSNGHLMAFQGTASAAHVQSLTSGTANVTGAATSGSIVLTVPAGGVPIGDLIVVCAVDNDDDLSSVAVTDTGGNTYTQEYQSSTNLASIAVFRCVVTTALSAGNTITITFSSLDATDQDVNLVAVADQFTGISSFLSEASNNAGTNSISIGPLSGISTLPVLLVASVATSEPSSTLTAGANFTKRTEAFNTGAALDADDRGAVIASRVVAELPEIVALHDWYSDAESTPAGTVTTVSGSTTVTGVGTTFTDHAPGDRIVVNNETRIIETITSTTILNTTDEWITANAGATYKLRTGSRIVTATSGGNLFKEKPLTLTTGDLDAVTLTGGLSQFARPGRFVQGGKEAAAVARKLFYFNGVDPVQVLSGDGTSTTNITAGPTDWDTVANQGEQPVNGLIHENRLLAWGNLNDPHRVYASDPDDHEDFTTAAALSMRFRSEIGDRIWCAASFQGVLFVWKYPRGIFYLDDTSLDPTEWSVRTKSELLGCAPSPYAALPLDDDVLFLAPDGSFHLLTAVDALGGTSASDVTRKLGLSKWLRDNLNLDRLDQTVSIYHAQKKLALFGVPSTNSTTNDLTLKFDFSGVERGLPVKFSYSTRDTNDALAMRRSPITGPEVPILGQASFVYLLDQDDRNANGVAYPATYQTADLDFSHLDPNLRYRRKLYEKLTLLMEPVASGTITVEVFVDGTLKQILSYDATKRRQTKKLNVGDGYTISLTITNAALDQNFKVLSHLVYFKVGNEDENR